jgi:hypothetical protein
MRKLYALAVSTVAALALAGVATAASVTVVHGVPDLAVDVYVNGEVALENFEFGTVTDPIQLPAGDYAIEIRAAGEPADSEPALSGSATVGEDTNASIVAHLDADGNPKLSVFVNDVSPIAAGESRVTVRHTAAAPAVDVLANDAALITNLANPDEASADVPADTYSVAVAATGTTEPVLGPTDLALAAGTSTIVYAVGSLEAGNLQLLAQEIAGLGAAPSGVPSGDSGLAATEAFPGWGIALLALAGIAVLGSGLVIARRGTR